MYKKYIRASQGPGRENGGQLVQRIAFLMEEYNSFGNRRGVVAQLVSRINAAYGKMFQTATFYVIHILAI